MQGKHQGGSCSNSNSSSRAGTPPELTGSAQNLLPAPSHLLLAPCAQTCPYMYFLDQQARGAALGGAQLAKQRPARRPPPAGRHSQALQSKAALPCLSYPSAACPSLQISIRVPLSQKTKKIEPVLGGEAEWRSAPRTEHTRCSECGHNVAFYQQVQFWGWRPGPAEKLHAQA